MNAVSVNNQIVGWLKAYAQSSGVKGFVVGISGGIDSAVVSCLCAQTGIDTLCVYLPIGKGISPQDRGLLHIDWLKEKYGSNVSSLVLDLTPTFDAFSRSVKDFDGGDLSLANVRSRLRMTALYFLAGSRGMLVVGTGNKIEDFGVGFFTKYGDGGVDLSPIGDLLKSEVYELATYQKILPSILEAAPTDGLFSDGRTDMDQLGASYPELERAMMQKNSGVCLCELQGREREVFLIYDRLNRANAHKMLPIPVCVINKDI